jgi:hypothetical protein
MSVPISNINCTHPPAEFKDGTLGVLVACPDIGSWSEGLVLAPVLCLQDFLPEETENLLSVILLPV